MAGFSLGNAATTWTRQIQSVEWIFIVLSKSCKCAYTDSGGCQANNRQRRLVAFWKQKKMGKYKMTKWNCEIGLNRFVEWKRSVFCQFCNIFFNFLHVNNAIYVTFREEKSMKLIKIDKWKHKLPTLKSLLRLLVFGSPIFFYISSALKLNGAANCLWHR